MSRLSSMSKIIAVNSFLFSLVNLPICLYNINKAYCLLFVIYPQRGISMKKAFIAVTAVLLALVVAAGVYILIDRSRFEDFIQDGVQEYRGYTRVNIQKHVYFLPEDAADFGDAIDFSAATDAGLFSVTGIIQPEKEDLYGGTSSNIFLGSMMVSAYPPDLEFGELGFFASVTGDSINISRMQALDGGAYKGITYWLIMCADDPDIFHVQIRRDGELIGTAYPGNSPEEVLASYKAFWTWFPGSK